MIIFKFIKVYKEMVTDNEFEVVNYKRYKGTSTDFEKWFEKFLHYQRMKIQQRFKLSEDRIHYNNKYSLLYDDNPIFDECVELTDEIVEERLASYKHDKPNYRFKTKKMRESILSEQIQDLNEINNELISLRMKIDEIEGILFEERNCHAYFF